MKQFSTLLGLGALLFITGCASTDEMVLDSTKRPVTTSVEIFKDGRVPDRKFKEIAEVSFVGAREDEFKAQRRFIQQAKQMGGNGLIFLIEQSGIKGGGTIFQTTAWLFKGKVIVYE